MQTENILEALTLSFDYIDVVAELRRFPENSASPEYNNGLRSYDKTFGQTDVSHSNGSLSRWSVGEILGVPAAAGRAIRYKAINLFLTLMIYAAFSLLSLTRRRVRR